MSYIDDIVYVDDCSTDNSVKIAKELGIHHIVCHDKNLGYGGNQKTMYSKALSMGADIIIMLHPDYQYDPALIPDILKEFDNGAEIVFGSRMLCHKEALKNGMPYYKYYSNRFLTVFQNWVFDQRLSEYHTGYRAYKSHVLKEINFKTLSNDFIFDNQMILESIKKDFKITEIYCPARYNKECSSINFRRSIKYGFLVLWNTFIYKFIK